MTRTASSKNTHAAILFAIATLVLVAGPAHAQDDTTPDAAAPQEESSILDAITLDIELDPIAYALSGMSVHGGITFGNFRLDFGAFGLTMPEFLHGNAGMEARFAGFGTKLDWIPNDELDGLFMGIEFGTAETVITHEDAAAFARHYNLSARVGYRVDIVGGLYIAPWIGVGYAFGPEEISVGDATYEHNPLLLFPTVHLGYRM